MLLGVACIYVSFSKSNIFKCYHVMLALQKLHCEERYCKGHGVFWQPATHIGS